ELRGARESQVRAARSTRLKRSIQGSSMKRFALVPLLLLATALADAQTTAPAAPPTGLVVGSGNFFSPIVANLDKAVAFYRDGLGLTVQGQPGDATANPALRDMFGLPDAKIRWVIARPPATMGGV